MAGDVNIHLDDTQNPDTVLFVNVLASFNLFQFVNSPTHNKGHTLDVVICNNIDGCTNISVTDVNLSDHYLINGFFKYQFKPTSCFKTIQYRNLKYIDQNIVFNELNEQQLLRTSHSTVQSFGEQVLSYNEMLTSIVNRHAPLQQKTIKEVPHAPWFDHEYRELRKKRRKAEKLYQQTKLSVHKLNYISLRKQTTTLSQQKKKLYARTKINEASNDKKALYSTLKMLTGQ